MVSSKKSPLFLTFLAAGLFASASLQAELRLNEVLARNQSFRDNQGSLSGWVELFNSGPTPVNLSGYSLSDSASQPTRYLFPAGTTLAPNGYLLLQCNTNKPVSASNTGLNINPDGESIYLYQPGAVLMDSVQFGHQIADFSLSRAPGSGQWELGQPTPAALNRPAALGEVQHLKINEWMADPKTGGEEYFELYNPDAQPVILGGLYLSDLSTDPTQFQIYSNSFLGSGNFSGFLKFTTGGKTNYARNQVQFGLSKNGDSILLSHATLGTLNSVTFGLQTLGVSQGRLPDGSDSIFSFASTPTPGQPNADLVILTNVVINEVLAHTDLPLEDAVEIHNPGDQSLDIGGWYLSNSRSDLKRYRIPFGTSIAPGGYAVLYEVKFNALNTKANQFTFNSAHGDEVFLTKADAAGNLIGYVSQAFGATENAVSLGRHLTSDGVDFVAMSRRTLGRDANQPLLDFRKGTGLPNATPKIGPIVINEIMYHPPNIGTNDNVLDEYIELKNITALPVPLYNTFNRSNTWRLAKAVDFSFPTNVVVPPDGTVLVVNFDPKAVDATAQLEAFKSKYQVSENVVLYGPYKGKLSNNSASVELEKPDRTQAPPHPDAGFVPFILVDKVKYNQAAPWPSEPDGLGLSLQRIQPLGYGNDSVNWRAAVPTPGVSEAILPHLLSQPAARQTVRVGGSVTLQVTAEGGAPLSYQWRLNGKALTNATGPTLELANIRSAQAGTYSLQVSNLAGRALSSNGVVVVDALKPSVAIQAPVAKARLLNPNVLVQGKAADAGGLSAVWVKLNEGDFAPAIGTTNWQFTTTLVAGNNRLLAYSVDAVGNHSLTTQVAVTYVESAPLALSISSGGTVLGATNGQWLEIGKRYLLTAKPALNHLFAGWNLGLTRSNAAILSLSMQRDLALSASFVTNPFIAAKGLYSGVFAPITPAETALTNSGSLTLTLTDRGTFSGKLTLAGVGYAMAGGQFDLEKKAHLTLKRVGAPSLVVDLDLSGLTQELSGTITDGQFTARVSGSTTVIPGTVPGLAGKYNLLIQAPAEGTGLPGRGTAVGIVDSKGNLSVKGGLGDGTAWSAIYPLVHLAPGRQGWYFHQALYKNRGFLLGSLFTLVPGKDFSLPNPIWADTSTNTVLWQKLPTPTEKVFKEGFRVETRATLAP